MIYISVLSVRGQLVIVLFAAEKRGWQTNLSLLTGDREAGRVAGLCGAGGGLGRCKGKGLKKENGRELQLFCQQFWIQV